MNMLRIILSIYMNLSVINSGVEPRQIIAVVDAGTTYSQLEDKAMCKLPSQSFIDETPVYTSQELSTLESPYQYHGVNVIGLIAKNLDSDKYCILSIKFYNSDRKKYSDEQRVDAYIKSIQFVTKINNLAGVNLSLNGPNLSKIEHDVIKKLLSKGIKVVASAGNESIKLSIPPFIYQTKMSDKARLNALNHYCASWPACLKPFFMLTKIDTSNFYVVGTNDGRLTTSDQFTIEKEEYQNQGPEQLTGTSQATANFTGKLFSKKEGIK